MNLTNKDWEIFREIIGRATRKELDELGDAISDEICLSDMAIEEDGEKNGWYRKYYYLQKVWRRRI